jgi:hydroxymethylpyrimidine pyrophosphatase-like HAD family hydrolase
LLHFLTHPRPELWNLVVFLCQLFDRYMNASARRHAGRSRSRTRSRRAKAAERNSTCRACRTLFPLSSNDPYYLDVTYPKANKGSVVELLTEFLKIPSAEMATIGDMPNDVLMFKKSGYSIAMGQAIKEVKKAATYVTAGMDEEGFAKAVEEFVLK